MTTEITPMDERELVLTRLVPRTNDVPTAFLELVADLLEGMPAHPA